MSSFLRAFIVVCLLLGSACSEDDPVADDVSSDDDDSPADDDSRGVARLDANVATKDAGTRDLDASLSRPLDARVDAVDTVGAADAWVREDGGVDASVDPFVMCTNTLRPRCARDANGVGCSGQLTPTVPLADGGTWGNSEVKFGPYGGFVSWNQGADHAIPPNALEGTCEVVASGFGEPMSFTNDVLDLRGQDLSLFTVFRPACMKQGETYPVITWGNGACFQANAYAPLLAAVASHGFVVIAANGRYVDGPALLKALDFARDLNTNKTSPLYQKLDLTKIGAMGHSYGSSAAEAAAADPRIQALILWNGAGSQTKPFLAISGERDVAGQTPENMASAVASAPFPGAWAFMHDVLQTGGGLTGHFTLLEQPERMVDLTVSWWKYTLRGDADARKKLVGASCGLCGTNNGFAYGQHELN